MLQWSWSRVVSPLATKAIVTWLKRRDVIRQEEINKFYDVCQMQREYYKGYPKRYHPYTYFREPEYEFQCPAEMSQVYLSFPPNHIKYKQPVVLPAKSEFPPLPDRNLAGRFNKPACKAFIR